jgi:hypothetical protein
MAVGHYRTRAGQIGHNLAERWNGRTWRAVRTAGPGGGLSAVSCTRAIRCIAVGQAGNLILAERWDGIRWRLLKAANP